MIKKSVIFYIIVFILYGLVAIHMPFNSGPDEAMRFAVLQDLVKFGRIANIYDNSSYFNPTWGWSYSVLLSNCGYILIFLCYKIVYVLNDSLDLLMFSRLFIAVVGVVNVIVLDKIIQALTNRTGFILQRVSVLSAVAFWPQLAFMFAYVNLDSFAILMTSLITLNFINGIKSNWTDNSLIYLYVITGFGIISYYNEFAIFLSCFLTVILSFILKYKKYDIKKLIVKNLIGLILLSVIVAPYVLNNLHYYDDLFGMSVIGNLQSVFAESFLRNTSLSDYGLGKGVLPLFSNLWFWENTLTSFIGQFGYMNIVYSASVYSIFTLFFIVFSLLGIKHFILSRLINSADGKIFVTFAACCVLVNFLMFVYYSYTSVLYQPQGRYLFPAFIYIVTFGLIGIYHIKNRYIHYFLIISIFLLYLYGLSLQFKFYHVTSLGELAVLKIIIIIFVATLVKYIIKFIPQNMSNFFISLLFIYFLYFGYVCNFYAVSSHGIYWRHIYNDFHHSFIGNSKIVQINNQDSNKNFFNVNSSNTTYLPLHISVIGEFSESSIIRLNGVYFNNIKMLYKYDASSGYTGLNFIITNFKVNSYNDFCVVDQYKEACSKFYLNNVRVDSNLSKQVTNFNQNNIIEHNIVFNIDTKEVTKKYFIISGWAFPENCLEFDDILLKMHHNNKVIYYISNHIVRQDVVDNYRCQNAVTSGFKFILPKELSEESINIVIRK